MKENSINFQFSENSASGGLEALHVFLKQEFSEWPREEFAATTSPKLSGTTRSDPALTISLISLAISVPSAILATWDLSQRMQLKQRLDRLIEWAKDRAARKEDNPFVERPDGSVRRLEDLKPEEILDSLTPPPNNRPG